jgi:hypothetical protein
MRIGGTEMRTNDTVTELALYASECCGAEFTCHYC